MGLHYYNYTIPVAPESNISPENLTEVIKKFFSKHPQFETKVVLDNDTYYCRIQISINKYNLYIEYSDADDLILEHQEMAEYRNIPALAFCKTSFYMSADDDPDDMYYDYHLMVVERFFDFEGIWVIDPLLGKTFGKGAINWFKEE